MTFGSDEFFERLQSCISSDTPSDHDIYKELVDVIKKYKGYEIYKKVRNKAAVEDILQEVNLAVFKGLVDFLLDSRNNAPAQREAWLNSIVRNKIVDYLRRENDEVDTTDPEGKPAKEYVPKAVSLEKITTDEDGNEREISANSKGAEDTYFDSFASDYLVRRLQHLFGLNVALDRLLGYCYSKIIIPLESAKGFTQRNSGKATDAALRLNGRNMAEIVSSFKNDLNGSLNRVFPDKLFLPLENRLNDKKKNSDVRWRDTTFMMKRTAISDATNDIQKKVDAETVRIQNGK